jgi:hypothetical protein
MDEIQLIERSGGHFYRTPIGILPSVTTIMRAVPKPQVESWKSRTPNWQEISQHARDVGSRTHRIIERYLKNGLIDQFYSDEIARSFSAFRCWLAASGFEPVESERMVWSESGYGGTVDLVGYLNDELYVIDIKTSRAVYPDYSLQIAAYRTGYEERTRERIRGMGIVRLDKPTGGFEWRAYDDEAYQSAWAAFSQLCESWHAVYGVEVRYDEHANFTD